MNARARPGLALWPLGLATCLSLFGDLALFAVLVDQLETVGLTVGTAGVMLGVHRLFRVGANPVVGLLFDRRDRRPLFLLGMLLAVLSTLGYGLLRGFWPFLATRLAWGAAWSLIQVGGLAVVIDVSGQENRGRWMGIYNAWVLAGLALGPVVGSLLVDRAGFRPAMIACAAISGVGMLIAWAALPESRVRHVRVYGDEGVVPAARLPSSLPYVASLYLLVQFTGEGVVLSTLTLLLQRRFGEQVALGGLALGVASASGLVLGLRSVFAGAVGPAAGHLSDRHAGRWLVVAVGLTAGLAGFTILAYARSLAAIVLSVVLGAAGSGAVLACLAALVGDLTPEGRQGAAMGAYATAGDIGSGAGPFLAFALVAAVDLRWVYLICSGSFVLGLLLVWAAARRSRKGSSGWSGTNGI